MAKRKKFWIERKSFSSFCLSAYEEKPDELTYRIAKDVIEVTELCSSDVVLSAEEFNLIMNRLNQMNGTIEQDENEDAYGLKEILETARKRCE